MHTYKEHCHSSAALKVTFKYLITIIIFITVIDLQLLDSKMQKKHP